MTAAIADRDSLAKAELGVVTLVPRSLIGPPERIASVPIGRHQPHFEIAIAAPTGRRMSAAARALLDHIRAARPGTA